MKITQIYEIMNAVTNEVIGKTDLIQEDLTGLVDLGNEILDANAVDAYVKSLVNHIGKVVFVNRAYKGFAPSVLMDAWEFGSVLEKITVDELPTAVTNETWSLQDGKSVDPYVFHAPKISTKFYNNKVTFEIEMSFTTRQVKQSFSNATQLNAFMSMIESSIEKSMTVKLDALIQRTVNNVIAETIASEYEDKKYNEKSGVRAVNLLYLYNQTVTASKKLTPGNAITNPDFIRFATFKLKQYEKRLGRLTTLFNVGGKDRFTPSDVLHILMLSDFKDSADVYLQSDTFNKEYTALPNAESVPYWQGTGNDYAFEKISAINVKNGKTDVNLSGILAIMFDRDCLGVSNLDRRVTSAYNPKGEFYNNFYKMDAGYFNDLNENAVVFFVA